MTMVVLIDNHWLSLKCARFYGSALHWLDKKNKKLGSYLVISRLGFYKRLIRKHSHVYITLTFPFSLFYLLITRTGLYIFFVQWIQRAYVRFNVFGWRTLHFFFHAYIAICTVCYCFTFLGGNLLHFQLLHLELQCCRQMNQKQSEMDRCMDVKWSLHRRIDKDAQSSRLHVGGQPVGGSGD